jgi:EpsI family protein
MSSLRVSSLVGGLMIAASGASVLLRPSVRADEVAPPIVLEELIPAQFGDWQRVEPGPVQLVNPEHARLLERSYNQVLNRVYVDHSGYRIMLSVAYGTDQREREVHLPEVCYPAQGFIIQMSEPGSIATAGGVLPVRRLVATTGTRHEPLTYWLIVGDRAIENKLQKKLVDLRYGVHGHVPPGMLLRVSSLDRVPARAYAVQEQFVGQLLAAVSPSERAHLAGTAGAEPSRMQ